MLFNLLIFFLVLSILVAVHEYGHFIAAKACNIYVDRFSVGMPPRLFGFKYGETDYCIGALPIGGYVKMAGQEDAPQSEEDRESDYAHVPPERFFNHKPGWQRAIVLIAGPAMNVVLAVFLYGIYAAVAKEVPEAELQARVGKVMEDAPAASAPLYRVDGDPAAFVIDGEPDAFGWESGDFIVAADGESIENVQRLAIRAIIQGESHLHRVLIERPGPDGSSTLYVSPVQPKRMNEDDPYPLFGVSSFETPVVRDTVAGLPAALAGLREDDIIHALDGKPVDRTVFIETIGATAPGTALTLEILRDGESVEVTVTPATRGRFEGLTFTSIDGQPEGAPVIATIDAEIAGLADIQPGDRIMAVNGVPKTFEELRDLEVASMGRTIELTVERPARLFGLRSPAVEKTVAVNVEESQWIGATLGPRFVEHRIPASRIVPEAFARSFEATTLTLNTLKALVTGNVSPKDLGGPVMIFDVTTRAAEIGWLWLIRIMAFISINLAIFNLLPLPILDGGQLVLVGIEAVRRKPMNPYIVERIQMFGLFLIISLMLFVTWNDIGRLLGGT